MNLNYLPALLLLLWGLAGCGGNEKPADEFLIEGVVRNHPGGMVILDRRDPDQVVPLDSVKVDEEGRFSFSGKGKPDILYQLRFGPNKAVGLIPDQDHITVEVDLEDLAQYQASGNAKTEQLRDFNLRQIRLFGEYIRNRRALNLVSRNVDPERWREQEARSDKALMTYREYLRSYADTTRFPVLSALAAMSMEVDPNYFFLQMYVPELRKKAPDSPYLNHLQKELNEVGEPFLRYEGEDIEATNHRGEAIRLSELRGKVVLIYAWASYCEYSRQENRRMAQLLSQSPREDFVIFSISIDEKEAEWRQALEEDQLPGRYHMRGNKGWDSDPFGFYAIGSIPTTYLLDYRGIIRSANVRADDLEEYLPYIIETYSRPAGSGS